MESPGRSIGLGRLLEALPEAELRGMGLETIQITGIAFDSREVCPGNIFVATRGATTDGHRFLADAVGRGATACVVENAESLATLSPDFPAAIVPDSRRALGRLAAAFWGYPGRRLKVIGVTGTDGKTTTATLIKSVLEAGGHRTGLVSTVAAVIGQRELDTGFHVTTPDSLALQCFLALMVEEGMEYAVVEATSHGLAQARVEGCEFDVAVITNITHEHLDYHSSFQEYRAAKGELFRSLATSYRKLGVAKVAVLNRDDSSFEYLAGFSADYRLTYGLHQAADLRAEGIHSSAKGLEFRAVTPGSTFAISSPLVGDYNVSNILAVVAVGHSQGIPAEAIVQGVARVSGIPGRMEPVDLGQNFAVIVDFAHTPNALERALAAARRLTQGRVIVVFGCAGLRDREKRPLMGEVAGRLADIAVITAEDPRTEDLDAIMEEIAAGCRRAGRQEGRDFYRVGDRAKAIAFAIGLAQAGDLVISTGKGHERSMCFGEMEYPWSDREAALAALERRLGR